MRSGMNACFLTVLILAMAVTGIPARAEGAGADPFSFWDYTVNPGAWGVFPDAMAAGVRAAAGLDALSSGSFAAAWEAAVGVPGLLYRYANDAGSASHELTRAAGLGPYLGFGLRFRWDSGLPAGIWWGYQDIGLVARPLAFVSMAVSMKDALDAAGDGLGDLGFGLAVRPLAFDPGLETLLTVGAEARYAHGEFSFDGVGARIVLDPWLSLRGWYAPASSTFGASLSFSLGGLETSAGVSSLSAAFGEAFRMGRATRDVQRLFGGSVLVLEDLESLDPTPPLLDYDPGVGKGRDPWYGRVLDAVDRAASDPSIMALVLLDPPALDSDARAQEFGRALGRFRAAGKQLYVHAKSLERLSYVYATAGADLLALDPNGLVALTDVASFSFYLKEALGKLGIEAYNLQSHEYKTANNMLSESGMTDAERSMMARIVKGLASQGHEALAAARGSRLKAGAAETVGNGPYLSAGAALEAGLVDSLLYREEFDDAVGKKTGRAPRVDLGTYARERGLSWGSASLDRRVEVVHLSGSIIEGEGAAGVSIGDSAAERLKALRGDPMTAGVILRVDSGGGSALTSDHIAREVKKLKEAGKPVIASMAGYAASGGYYISAYADEIFAEAGTLTGSIGVAAVSFSAVDLLKNLGIGVDGVSAGPSGGFGSVFMPRRERDTEVYRAYVRYVYDRFVAVVAEGRKMDKAKVDGLGKGQIWLGSEAVANGLVDRIGGLDDAKAAMEKRLGGRARFVDSVPGNPAQGLLSTGVRAAVSAALGLDAAPEALADALRMVKEVASMGGGPLYLEPACLMGVR